MTMMKLSHLKKPIAAVGMCSKQRHFNADRLEGETVRKIHRQTQTDTRYLRLLNSARRYVPSIHVLLASDFIYGT